MTESGRDPEISRRYRELAREEPPHALDEAILAAARRELEMRPAPLVAPTARRSWAVPVAAAAVIVLSAIVTLQIQRDQPDAELAVPPAPPAAPKDEPPAAARPAAKPQAAERRKAQEPSLASRPAPRPARAPAAAQPPPAPAAEPAQPKPPSDPGRFAPDPERAAPPAAAEPQSRPLAPAAKPAPRTAEAAGSAIGRSAPLASDALSKRAEEAEPPERTLARIVVLRREGRHKEADELYAEFRQRFPEYRIPEAMREQVLPR